MPTGTLLYAQSGGVTAVINATAAGGDHRGARARGSRCSPPATASSASLREDLIDTSAEPAAAIRGLAHTPGGAFGSCRRQAQVARRGPRPLRAAAGGAAGPRRPLVPLQRRQRLRRHRAQGVAARRRVRLPAHLHRRAEDHRQRPRRHRLLPRLRLGGEIHRRLGPRMRARRRRHRRHLDQGLRLRGDGPPRRLARRRRRPRRPQRRTRRRTSSSSPSAPTTRPTSSPRSQAVVARVGYCVVVASEGIRDADGRFVADAGAGKDAFGHTQLGGVASFLAGRVKNELGLKVHWTLPDYLQRSARHLASSDRPRAGAGGRHRRRRPARSRAERHDAGDPPQPPTRPTPGTSPSRRWTRSPTARRSCRAASSAPTATASPPPPAATSSR